MKLTVPIPRNQPAVTMSGELTDFSSETAHTHQCHQFLVIDSGVSILIDQTMKQPLYGNMCAFLPADFAHRSVVAGGSIAYQSVYLRKELFFPSLHGIRIFPLSQLALSLHQRLVSDTVQDFRDEPLRDILSLFLKLMPEEMNGSADSIRLPRAESEECGKIVGFIEENFRKKISLTQFCSVLPYSTRHIARLFCSEMKMTMFEYLRIYRMVHASVALHHREKTVLEVSLDCGYESLSAFYADFGRTFSGTPGEFRKSVSVLKTADKSPR